MVDNLGSPYGGCGLPQDQLETQNWIALNVFNTPLRLHDVLAADGCR